MKCYIQYKDSGIQWLGEIPSHWEIVPLYSVASYNDESWDESTPKETVINYVEISDVTLENGIKNVSHVEFGSAPSRARRKTRIGDIIISTVRTYLRAVAPITADDITVSTGFAVLRPQKVNSKYLMYYTVSSGFIADVIGNSEGTSYPAINASELVHLKIALPPRTEQQAIASYLDTATAKIDEAIAQQQKMIDLLNERKQIIINNAVTKGLNPNAKMKPSGIDWIGNIPEHWEVMQYRHLFYNLDNLRQPISADQRSRNNPQYDYYGASGVIDKIDYYNVDDRVLLIGEDGANLLLRNLPLIYKAKGKFWVNNHAHILKPIRDDYDYMAYVMEAADYTLFITGSAQPKLSQSNLNAVKLPIPPIEEQQSIVKYLEQRTEKIDTAISNSSKQIALLQERKQIIINDVVTGKINII